MTDRKIQYSTFIGNDQLVMRTDSVEELVEIVTALAGSETESGESAYSIVLNATQRIKAVGLVGMNPALNASAPTPPTMRAGSAPPQRQAQGSDKACNQCGAAMEMRSGGGGDTGKKAWKGWFCTANKSHSPIWVK